ncbi:MAG: hypothetical protein ISS28_01955 [Candidatus Cloacimonetes bacterium]|nr:hypothetical protein [Candidatus Cloacimonadota bacterium]MBL7085852.1 hypothetical protein [Candidatus Cloacimonadota bacterium]
MKDTSYEMRKLYHKMLMKKSGEERFLMGISLCETVRKMVLASFPDNINEDEKHVKLLLRYYKNEFPTNEMNKIIDNIKTTQ